jgi:hypothetical protein
MRERLVEGKEAGMVRPNHLIRNARLALIGVAALVVAATLLEGGALGIIVALVALGVAAAVLPVIVIHYDEHPDRLERIHPH